MPNTAQVSTERRQQANQLIAELQNERQELWSLYFHVAELKPFSAKKQVKNVLTEFSQILVDYVSLGHFGVYERILAGNERRTRVLSVAKDIYPEFSATTEAAISFNDKYEKISESNSFDNLEKELSALGENLAKRIDLEDKLCQLLKN
jgi:regulator of sigma D